MTQSESAQQRMSLGVKQMAEGAYGAARDHFHAATRLAPHSANAHYNLARAHAALGEFTLARAAALQAIELDPNHAAAAHTLGALLVEYGRTDEAIPWLRRALALKPDDADIMRDLGASLLFLGRIDEARTLLLRVVELNPQANEAIDTLTRLQRMDDGSAEAEAVAAVIERTAGRLDEFDPAGRSQVLYALGKTYEDRGEYDRAFDCMAEANALRRKTVDFDIEETERRMESIAEVFDAERIASLAGAGDPSARPIFVLGMPRSGTTLVEQILSAHPAVFGAGEHSILNDLIAGVRGHGGALYPYWAEEMTASDCQGFGQLYLKRALKGEAGQAHATDKWLDNFLHLGLIHLALPNAKIIHCRRDPLDNCFSCYALRFSLGQDFTYDLEELGRYWRAYDRLMAHWRAVLPPGRFLDVSYEGVVADLETWARRMIDYCGLPWDDACLRYYESKRQVRSASFAQVRKPIYADSIGRWKPFARHLGPLLQAMGEPWDGMAAQSLPGEPVSR